MHRIWRYISGLGVTGLEQQLDQRTIVLTNQLNFVTFLTMFLLLIVTVTTLFISGDPIVYGTLRVVVMLVVSFLNLVLARLGFQWLSRLSIIFLPPVVFLLGPTMIGYVEEESYTYYPYVIIGASIIPQMLIQPKKEKTLFWISLFYYFILTLIIDKVMVNLSTRSFPIVDRINTFYPFYKIAQVALFMFINACIYYLRVLNSRFEEELKEKNKELDQQNIELKHQKEKIEMQKDELLSKEISTWQKLVNIMTHEIVNSAIPITNLAGMTGQLLEDESGAVLKPEMISEEITTDIHHGLKIIETRTKSLINFVKATKSISQIPLPNIRRFPLKDLFDRITLLYQVKFKETGVTFETRITPQDLSIEADLELIEQVIINLIQNALEAMQDFQYPRLSMEAFISNSGNVHISVSDNGPGIKDEIIERIFLPFYSTKNNKSGIGLSLSQQVMLLHHGRLEVSSEPGKGATFFLIF